MVLRNWDHGVIVSGNHDKNQRGNQLKGIPDEIQLAISRAKVRASIDPDFRCRLLSDPLQTLLSYGLITQETTRQVVFYDCRRSPVEQRPDVIAVILEIPIFEETTSEEVLDEMMDSRIELMSRKACSNPIDRSKQAAQGTDETVAPPGE